MSETKRIIDLRFPLAHTMRKRLVETTPEAIAGDRERAAQALLKLAESAAHRARDRAALAARMAQRRPEIDEMHRLARELGERLIVGETPDPAKVERYKALRAKYPAH